MNPQKMHKSYTLQWINYAWKEYGTLSAVVLLALVLRLFRIGYQSLWGDEAFSVGVSRLSLPEMTEPLVNISWNHPPLHYYLLHFWLRIFGVGDFQARLLSTVFGTLSIIMIFMLARDLFDRRTAFMAALLLAVSQLGVMYSQEARPYAQLLFFVLCSIYLFAKVLRERNLITWVGFVSSSILMLYTNYYSLLLLVSMFLFILMYRSRYPLPVSWVIGGIVATALVFIPWLMTGVIGEALKVNAVSREQPSWFAVDKWTIFDTINTFDNGKVNGLLNLSPRWTFAVGGFLFLVPLFLSLLPVIKRDYSTFDRRKYIEHFIFLTLLWSLPVVVIIGLSRLFRIQYDVRYSAFCIAPYYILIARGIANVKQTMPRVFLIFLILVYSGYSLRANYFFPYKENYRDALAYLAGEYKVGDCAIFLPFGDIPLQWSIYQGDDSLLKVTSPEVVTKGQSNCNRIWVTTYRRIEWAVNVDEEGERMIEALYYKAEKKQYFWVNVDLYLPK
jgi:4-amino-4-deoxy-L-arabinose transferase-like glycosyltransferase